MAGHPRSRREFLGYTAAAIAFPRVSLGGGLASTNWPEPPGLGTVRAGGDLAKRARQNMGRLECDSYKPPLVFAGPNAKSWPGDFEGRALLAITLLARTTGEEPGYLRSMLPAYKARLNSQGCFGDPLDVHAINEQQLSGHGWFLRGLCEYYEYTRDSAALSMAKEVVHNLALPLKGRYLTYPIDPALRTHGGGVTGSITARQGDWILSTDIGCAFIFVDGLAHVWTLVGTPRLKTVIDEAIQRFLEIDLVAMGAQTHATLTCLRAILRVYEKTKDPALLTAVRSRYQLYRAVGMTEHYANYNWFNRPETWTEPCAIIDSFMIAFQLWQFTGERAYLEDAHLIWFNGVGRGLRGNGGYGTDRCAGFKSPFLALRTYEAFFCCTMRGGEGHARAVQYTYATRDNEISLPFYSDSEAALTVKGGSLTLRQTAAYPYQGAVRLEVLRSSCAAPVTIRFFAPQWTRDHELSINEKVVPTEIANGFVSVRLRAKAGDVLLLKHQLRVGPRDTLNPRSLQGYYAFEAGPLLLGHESETPVAIARNADLIEIGPGRYKVKETGVVLSRINDLNEGHAGPKDPCSRQILFRNT